MIDDKLVYLNEKRIEIQNSREYFWGKKLLKYINLLKRLSFLSILSELSHDTYAFFFKNNSSHKIIDFEKECINEFPDKIAVYTSIFGNYDDILEPLQIDPNCNYYIFTDQEVPSDSIWQKMDCSSIPSECNTAALKNRYVKMFPYKFFDCKYSIYLDGNLQIVGRPSKMVQQSIITSKTGIGMHLAPRENCIYEEAKTVCHVGKISASERDSVLKLYRDSAMPRHYGMCECNVIVRDHENPTMKHLMDEWWMHYFNGVKRDQLYFTYILYKNNFNFSDVYNFGASVNKNSLFIRIEHNSI